MSIHVALNHVTRYRYDRPVRLAPQLVRLRPAPHCRSNILSYSLRIDPGKHFINWQQDPQSNYLARLVFTEPTREFRVEVDLVTEMAVFNPFDFFLEPEAEEIPFAYDPDLAPELLPFLRRDEPTPCFADYLAGIARENRRTVDFLVGLNRQLSKDVKYLIRLEPGVQTPEDTLRLASGSCRSTPSCTTSTTARKSSRRSASRPSRCSPTPSTGRKCRAWRWPAASTRISPASTWCAPGRPARTPSSTCWKTTFACPRACR